MFKIIIQYYDLHINYNNECMKKNQYTLINIDVIKKKQRSMKLVISIEVFLARENV